MPKKDSQKPEEEKDKPQRMANTKSLITNLLGEESEATLTYSGTIMGVTKCEAKSPYKSCYMKGSVH